MVDFWTDLREPSECYPGVVARPVAELPCGSLPPWSDDLAEVCPFCNVAQDEPCGLENELTDTE